MARLKPILPPTREEITHGFLWWKKRDVTFAAHIPSTDLIGSCVAGMIQALEREAANKTKIRNLNLAFNGVREDAEEAHDRLADKMRASTIFFNYAESPRVGQINRGLPQLDGLGRAGKPVSAENFDPDLIEHIAAMQKKQAEGMKNAKATVHSITTRNKFYRATPQDGQTLYVVDVTFEGCTRCFDLGFLSLITDCEFEEMGRHSCGYSIRVNLDGSAHPDPENSFGGPVDDTEHPPFRVCLVYSAKPGLEAASVVYNNQPGLTESLTPVTAGRDIDEDGTPI